jgi:hypothetical protein
MLHHIMSFRTRAGALALAGFALLLPLAAASSAGADIRIRFGTRERPLEGRRYETMRALAHYLDERAAYAAEQASDERRGDRRDRRFGDSVVRFSKQSRSFHERMDRYVDSPWDVPNEVGRLLEEARDVKGRIKDARISGETVEAWNDVLDVLDRMERVLAGEDVEVPSPHRRGWRDYDRDYRGYDREHDHR